MFYFEAQTGIVRDSLPAFSNYFQYRIPSRFMSVVEEAVGSAEIGPSGLVYGRRFMEFLSKWMRGNGDRR